MFYVANPAPYPPPLSPLEVVYIVYMLISIFFMVYLLLKIEGIVDEFYTISCKLAKIIEQLKELIKKGE